MKQIQSLLRFLPAAVLALGLALPARAALQTMDDEAFALVTTLNVTMQQGETRTFFVSESDSTVDKNINIQSQSPSSIEVSPIVQSLQQSENQGWTFTAVSATGAGTPAVVRIYQQNNTANLVVFNITVTAGENSFTWLVDGEPSLTGSISLDEGSRVDVTARLATKVVETTVFHITSSDTDLITVSPDSQTVLARGEGLSFTIDALDGFNGANPTVTVASEDGSIVGTLFVRVNNVDPVITTPNPEEPPEFTRTANKPSTYTGVAKDDGTVDNASLVYTWDFGDGTAVVTGRQVSHAYAGEGEYTGTLTVTDKDGASAVSTFTVIVEPGVIVKLDTPGELERTLAGVARASDFTFETPAGTTWIPAGNPFGPKEPFVADVILPDRVYPFGWLVPDEITGGNTARLETGWNAITQLSGNAPDSGIATVYYVGSLAWRGNDIIVGVDGDGNDVVVNPDTFGDIDQDGLPDIWETRYFGQVNMDTILDEGFAAASDKQPSDEDEPIQHPRYTADGNPDHDHLPPYASVVVTNKVDGGLIQVFDYPLDCSIGVRSYATIAWDEIPPDWLSSVAAAYDTQLTQNGYPRRQSFVPFSNFMEFRGVPECRVDADTGDFSLDEAGRYLWRYYTDPNPTKYTRGPSPVTDPTSADSNNNGRDDGWEYYFWLTLKYDVHPERWRAYDPTFSLYAPSSGNYTPNANPGLPLLKTEVGNFEAVTEAKPDDPWDVFAYYGSVTNAPIVNTNMSVRVNYPNGFQLFNLLGAMDSRGNSILYYVGTDLMPHPTDGWINLLTGDYYIPGVADFLLKEAEYPDFFPKGAPDEGGLDWSDPAPILQIAAVHQDGLFSREYLMSLFDPASTASGVRQPENADELPYAWYRDDTVTNNYSTLSVNASAQRPMPYVRWQPDFDIDNDGLSNLEEYYLGTDPLNWDTDNDGMPDGWEVMNGLLPLDARNGDALQSGPNDNPDDDWMASGSFGHRHWLVQKYRWDHGTEGGIQFRLEYEGRNASLFADLWNGGANGCFIPGEASTSGANFSNREEFLFARYLIAMGLASTVYPGMWNDCTSDPLNDDTNDNGLPDGWEAYVCCDPIWLPNADTIDPEAGDSDEAMWSLSYLPVYTYRGYTMDLKFQDEDGIGLWAEFDNQAIADKRDADVEFEMPSGSMCVRHAFPRLNPDWTNKPLPTDPSCDDTDGDGIPDGTEYQEGYDYNGDEVGLANFNPTTADTDGDWLPDGWELVMGNYETNHSDAVFGTYGDPDGDGLANYQEYLTGSQYGWRYDWWYAPNNTVFWRPLSGLDDDSVGFVYYRAGDFFRPEADFATMFIASNLLEKLEARYGIPDDVGDSKWGGRWSNVGVQQRCEAIMDANGLNIMMIAWQGRVDVTKDMDPYGYISVNEADVFMYLYMNIGNWGHYSMGGGGSFNRGRGTFGWDGAGNSGTGDPTPEWTYIPNNYLGPAGFPGTSPRMADTDSDGMPDYWELYHGLNPTYGGCRLTSMIADGLNERLQGANAHNVDADRADGGPTVLDVYVGEDGYVGDGSQNNWRMGWDPTYVRNMHQTMVGLRPVSLIETTSFVHLLCPPQMEWGHFDPVLRPWLSGDRVADPDQDGLSNEEEATSYLANDILHHTDPSPYWLTDTSDPNSYVNLYYRTAGLAPYWWWDQPLIGVSGDPPTYLFDFEVNEGYDTDNNNIADRDELTDTDGHRATDPLDLDSPIARKAMYFDGNAACRTRQPFFHDKYSLASFTVEFWFRAQEPVSDRTQTLIHRPVLMPVNEGSGAYAWTTRNTFCVELDPEGHLVARIDNDAIEQASQSSVSIRGGRVVPNIWNHVAVSMDSVGNTFTMYLNGEVAATASTSLKPCTGILLGLDHIDHGEDNGPYTYDVLNYDYSPAPIVVGAYDTNGWGVVSGYNINGTRDAFQQPMFDESKFYKGWIDEIRVWDRCRSQSEINNSMKKRFTKADIAPINQERFFWDNIYLPGATSLSDFPQKLLYHYSFDNLPDVARAPAERDDTFLSPHDTDKYPQGWDLVADGTGRSGGFTGVEEAANAGVLGTRHFAAPWWYTANHRSTVYSPDFSYVPYIENTVAHMPQRPPQDMKELVPLYNAYYELYGYRFRATADWMQDVYEYLYPMVQSAYPIEPNPVSTEAPAVELEQVRNSMNPYGETYHTSISVGYERNTANFGGHLDRWGQYEYVPILSDMLPLLDAVADIDVPMWDDERPGWDLSAIDSDGDGLPDWWEIAHGLDPNDATGVNGAYGDSDGDGLDNYAEYLAGTDPHAADTDGDGYSDYFSRADGTSLTYGELYDDGDGMDNAWEIAHGLSPDRFDADTDPDNDGWSNWSEYMAQTDPTDPGDYPHPKFNVTYHYDGEQAELTGLGVYPYGEKTTGDTMGGSFDGRYTMGVDHGEQTYLGIDGVVTLGEHSDIGLQGTFGTTKLQHGLVESATITVQVPTAEGYEARQFTMAIANEALGQFTADNDGWLFMELESGRLYMNGVYYGCRAMVNYRVKSYSFPESFSNLIRNPFGAHTHMVEGSNRFLGWMDVNGNQEFDFGEPMGISLYNPTIAGWDSVQTEIMLSDGLWDFPRLSWVDAPASTNVPSPNEYIVTLRWVGSSSESEESETTTTTVGGGGYGDIDGDGLDSFQESRAGTDVDKMDTAGDGRMDYDSQSAAGQLTWGERYDDGDMMPAQWEIANGTDPDNYDADADPDDDGWTNYEEYLAGTDPTDAAAFPTPQLDVTFLYSGSFSAATNASMNPTIAAYSERRKGTYLDGNRSRGIYMGGEYDGRYTMHGTIVGEQGILGVGGSHTVEGVSFAAVPLYYGHVREATLEVWEEDSQEAAEEYTSSEFNEELLQFVDERDTKIYLERETGLLLCSGNLVGRRFSIDYTIDGYTYPLEINSFIRANGTHAVGGYNRFFGWLDGDGDGQWGAGEPAGLSLYNATLVSPHSAKTTIPLSDGLFGFPRIFWPAATNANVTSYKVMIWDGNGDSALVDNAGNFVDGIVVEAPRTFIHEGDYIEHNIRGLNLGAGETDVFTWTVWADNGIEEEILAEGDFVVSLVPNVGPRRAMKAVSPVAGNTVYGSLVEFKWQMDWRTEGVFFTVKNSSGSAVAGLDNLYVPFPVLHGRTTDDDYYYSYIPQLENGRSIVNLPSGTYTYTIKPNVRTTSAAYTDAEKAGISGTFKIDNADTSRTKAAINGHVHYYGRLGTDLVPGKVVVQAYEIPNSAETSLSVGGNPIARTTVAAADGSFSLHGISAGSYAVIGWVDSDGDGKFTASDTQGFGFLGNSACPNQIPGWCPPLVVTNSTKMVAVDLDDVHVVLRDRDVNGDGKPESYSGSAAAWQAAVLRTFPNPTAAQLETLGWVNAYLFSTTRVVRVITSTSSSRQKSFEYVTKRYVVQAPRLFFHEWDQIRLGKKNNDATEYGLNLGVTNVIGVSWNVAASDGYRSEKIAQGDFVVNAGLPPGSERDPRRTMRAIWPTQLTKVYGSVVEFEWEMDWRNAGVRFVLENIDGDEPVEVFNGVIPMPVRHGKTTTQNYYYTCKPQLEDGLRFLDLPSGKYRYTITERPRTSMFAAQSVSGTFQKVNEDTARSVHSIAGRVEYYGKVMESETVAAGIAAGDGASRVLTALVDTNLVHRGAMGVYVMKGGEPVETLNDSKGDGVLHSESAPNAYSGSIAYKSDADPTKAEITVNFLVPPEADTTLDLVVKKFPSPLVIQAFKVPENAESALSFSGTPVAQTIQEEKGAYKVDGLGQGAYAVRAWIDSNGNRIPDGWETIGFATYSSTVSPNLDRAAAPIRVTNDVINTVIVLHDRDTDNDLLPDAWEHWKFGGLNTSGYEQTQPDLYIWQEYADGLLDSDPRTPDTDLDGLTDAMEILVTKTDTHKRDTDGDGIGDLEEFLSGSDPLDADDAVPYAVPALAFDENGTPFVDIGYPSIQPGVVLTYELQRKLSLDPAEPWETVCDHEVVNDGSGDLVGASDGVNARLTPPGTVRMKPAEQAEDVDFETGFFRIKVYADYGRMVDNGDGTWSYWTWVRHGIDRWDYEEAARGEGTLVRDADGNWSFVSDASGLRETLVRGEDGSWSFQE